VNVQLDASTPSGMLPLTIQVGGTSSQTLSVAVQ
jgi:hypothetical protein